MLKIVRVGALDGEQLDIEFNNGHIVLLELASKMGEADFAALREDGRICSPKTDGERVYWTDGPSLTVAEIMEVLQGIPDEQPQAQGNCNVKKDAEQEEGKL